MNRPIKFRAWDKTNKCWVYMEIDQAGNFLSRVTPLIKTSGSVTYGELGPWLQFTGLLDKNGKEIYEGDVVEFSSFEEGKMRLEVKIPDIYIENRNHSFAGICEVIGNIYEHPDLIK